MQGSLCLKNGVLYVGRHARAAEVRAYDLDGRRLAGGLHFAGDDGGPAAASGLAVDDDHRIWVADTPGRRVRAFTLVGRELTGFPRGEEHDPDRPGATGAVRDVAHAGGEEEDARYYVAGDGARRHGLQLFRPDGGFDLSLRPLGDPNGRFQGVTGVAVHARFVYASEPRAHRVQVFRDDDFHFLIRVPASGGAAFEPVAACPVGDGRVVVAVRGRGSGLLVVDGSGALRSVLAGPGRGHGEVFEPADVACEPGEDDRHTRVVAIDCDGDRVQVFNLEGRCYGRFEDLPHTSA